MASTIASVIEFAGVRCLFQPIVSARSRRVLGYEATAYGPCNGPLHSPLTLSAAAQAAGLSAKLDTLSFDIAIKQRSEQGLPGRLHLNVTMDGLLALSRTPAQLRQHLAAQAMTPSDLVLELSEPDVIANRDTVADAMARCRTIGVRFAVDDFCLEHAMHASVFELAPEFVKVSRYIVADIHASPATQTLLAAVVAQANSMECAVLADGVDLADDAQALIRTGVRGLQGGFAGRATATPEPPVGSASATIVVESGARDLQRFGTARTLAFEQTPISPDVLVSAVADIFHGEPDLEAVPVVEKGLAVGIVRRGAFLDLMSMPLRYELHAKKAIRHLMQETPLVVDADLPLEQVSRIVTSGDQTRLHEQFIIVENSRYLGMAKVIDLLREITAEQVQLARYSNPLTLLPGNVPIYDCINNAVAQHEKFVLCHVDVDNFKPFNDFYGYGKGDEALMMIADVLTRSACSRTDFVGHVGGDDFVLVFRSEDWRARVQCCFEEIEALRSSLYPPEDIERGYIVTGDRKGKGRSFPLLSISVAALACAESTRQSAEDLIQRLAPIKSRAKRTIGNALEVVECDDCGDSATSGDSAIRYAGGIGSHRG